MSVIEDWLVHLLMKKNGIQAKQVETDREEESSSSFNEEYWDELEELYKASAAGDLDKVKYLIEVKKVNVNGECNEDTDEPLHYACQEDKFEVARC